VKSGSGSNQISRISSFFIGTCYFESYLVTAGVIATGQVTTYLQPGIACTRLVDFN